MEKKKMKWSYEINVILIFCDDKGVYPWVVLIGFTNGSIGECGKFII